MNENVKKEHTFFLPAARVDLETIRRQHHLFAGDEAFRAVLDAIPNAVVVLNAQRQIVYANASFSELSPEVDLMGLLGMRVGEALNCLNLPENPGGCGTGKFCATCGAAHALAAAGWGQRKVEECRILRQIEGATVPLDLRVTATPYEMADATYTIFVISDIGDEKRRQVLERLFFHDIGNTVGNIRGLAELLVTQAGENGDGRFAQLVYQASNRLMDEVDAQRQILAAEEGRLEVNLLPLPLPAFLEELLTFYAAHPVASGRKLSLQPGAAFTLHTDSALLGRILGNMLKNGLEAVQTGETVTLGYEAEEEEVCLWVHNPGAIPPHVRLQLFHRSFSTKSTARGLGTYSMKLLAEQYLGGKVAFSSSSEAGTVFTVSLPRTEGRTAQS